MTQAQKKAAGSAVDPCTSAVIEITRAQLPLHCPMPATALWNSHPRVFLPIEETGEARCPYCGTLYVLAKT
jgi:uncharacterized Zn-finger protein